ncbi:MAG: ABC transporter ATP-binding protein [Oscillospiraceae bacterium]
MTNEILLEVKDLQKHFYTKRDGKKRVVHAVDNITFNLHKGETFGLVGESGCGKSTTGRSIIRLLEPTAGEVHFKGDDILSYDKQQMRALRQQMQIIFQDPYSSLNPRMNVSELVGEALIAQKLFPRRNADWHARVREITEMCGIQNFQLNRYPHQFSGGQRQRICIARALALNPEFVVCDEPVSALDVSIQSAIINLLMDLQSQMGLSYLFISHDLSVVKHISNRIGVMYLGNMVEMADRNDLFTNPIHPYTEALLDSVPIPDPEVKRELRVVEGDIPSNVKPPSGCRFRTRCRYAKDICAEEVPEFKDYGNGHRAACHFPLCKG